MRTQACNDMVRDNEDLILGFSYIQILLLDLEMGTYWCHGAQ
jgi:hypothetical protein